MQEFDVSSATVEFATEALGVESVRIARTISLRDENSCVLIATTGDGEIDNSAFERHFGMKARMLAPEETEEPTDYRVGGICPFDNLERVKVHLSESLHRFQTVSPACGTSNSAIELMCDESLECSRVQGWIDICKGWKE